MTRVLQRAYCGSWNGCCQKWFSKSWRISHCNYFLFCSVCGKFVKLAWDEIKRTYPYLQVKLHAKQTGDLHLGLSHMSLSLVSYVAWSNYRGIIFYSPWLRLQVQWRGYPPTGSNMYNLGDIKVSCPRTQYAWQGLKPRPRSWGKHTIHEASPAWLLLLHVNQ